MSPRPAAPFWLATTGIAISICRSSASAGSAPHDSHLHVGDLELPLAPGIWSGFAAGLEPLTTPDLDAALERRRGP